MLPFRVRVDLGAPHSPKLHHYRNLTTRFIFSHIEETRWWWGSYPSAEMQSVYSTAPSKWAKCVCVCVCVCVCEDEQKGLWQIRIFCYFVYLLYDCGMIFILSFFVGYILSFGLVRLRTIRLSARAGSHIECRWFWKKAELRSEAGRGQLRFEAGRGESSLRPTGCTVRLLGQMERAA